MTPDPRMAFADRSPDAMRILGARARKEIADQDPALRTWQAFTASVGFQQFRSQAGLNSQELRWMREGFEEWQALPIVPPTGYQPRELATPIEVTDRQEVEEEGVKVWRPVPREIVGRFHDGRRVIVREMGPLKAQRDLALR